MDEELEFRTLLGFLERFEVEVSGRSNQLVDPVTESKIRELAAGKLRGAEQEQVLADVARSRASLGLLAELLNTR